MSQTRKATYITKRRQSLSCSARLFSDILVMKKSSADYCSHEGQIHSSGSSSLFAQQLKEESHGLILLGNFQQLH